MKKKKKEVLSLRLTDEYQWIVKALEKKMKQESRVTMSGALLAHLVQTLKP